MPKGLTCQFTAGSFAYERLLEVFKRSWQKNSSITLEVHRINPPEAGKRHNSFYYNHKKLQVWKDNFSEDTVFLDCDMLLLRDISGGFDLIDNIGVAHRSNLPLNGGVIFAKHNANTVQFFEDWYSKDAKMLSNPEIHMPYHRKYAGLNQSSLGYLIENGHKDLITRLPEAYNLCESWEDWQNAKLIHLKGSLRRTCLMDRVSPPDPQGKIRDIWKSYED